MTGGDNLPVVLAKMTPAGETTDQVAMDDVLQVVRSVCADGCDDQAERLCRNSRGLVRALVEDFFPTGGNH